MLRSGPPLIMKSPVTPTPHKEDPMAKAKKPAKKAVKKTAKKAAKKK